MEATIAWEVMRQNNVFSAVMSFSMKVIGTGIQ